MYKEIYLYIYSINLQDRVDSIYEADDTSRFILGALLFSIVLFIFPTVLLFYIVFVILRLLCKVLQAKMDQFFFVSKIEIVINIDDF